MIAPVNKPLEDQTKQVPAEKAASAERPGKGPLDKNSRVVDLAGKAVATLLRALGAWPC